MRQKANSNRLGARIPGGTLPIQIGDGRWPVLPGERKGIIPHEEHQWYKHVLGAVPEKEVPDRIWNGSEDNGNSTSKKGG